MYWYNDNDDGDDDDDDDDGDDDDDLRIKISERNTQRFDDSMSSFLSEERIKIWWLASRQLQEFGGLLRWVSISSEGEGGYSNTPIGIMLERVELRGGISETLIYRIGVAKGPYSTVRPMEFD